MDFYKDQRSFIHAKYILSAPIIYTMGIPIVFFDICLEIYHHLCFPLYGLPLVDRSRYIRVDRHQLDYLSPLEKFNCAYCGYANGFMAYATKIIARTEAYWCGIKHQSKPDFKAPAHHRDFLVYGDERAYCRLRDQAENRIRLGTYSRLALVIVLGVGVGIFILKVHGRL